MTMDLRLPIGLLLAIIGAILTAQGLLADASLYRRSLGININLVWGSVLLLIGAGMVIAARRSAGKDRK